MSTPEQNQKGENSQGLIPANIAGINLKEGLENAICNEQLYHKILKSFYNQFHSIIADLRNASDQNEGRHLAHSLKGVCSTIGATEISEITAKLETSFRSGETNNDLLITELESNLLPLLADLEKMLSTNETSK